MSDSVKPLNHKLLNRYIDRFPEDVAARASRMKISDVCEVLQSVDTPRAVQILDRLTPMMVKEIFEALPLQQTLAIAIKIDHGRLAHVLNQVKEPQKTEILDALEPALKKEITDLLSYPEGTAGSVMDAKVMTFSPEQTVRDIMNRIKPFRERKVHSIYLVDKDSKLMGWVPLQEAILAKSTTRLKDLSTAVPVSVQAMSPREEAVDLFSAHKLTSLPVVDLNGVLLGVIRQDAVIQVLEQDSTADIQTMVGAGREERALSSPLFSVRKRLPWLNINLLTAFVAAAVVGFFENTIAQVTALAVLLPVVAGQSGNTGAQALAVTMRGLALREVRVRHWPQLVMKETIAGFLNGVAIAIVTGLGVLLWSKSVGLSLVIAVSMVIAMAIAGAAGASIPIILTKLGQDPAQSSSIILTTVTDVFGFLSFLGLATLFISFL